ncbi:MAG: hypothetical protein B6U72_07335 [Candidatus Altiarchaeales archaeon ex4484_2]|nr:MAG: hypothetical protein B6U72_07335 [Candidatus Altiarchaeales archaeon ex4484_2]
MDLVSTLAAIAALVLFGVLFLLFFFGILSSVFGVALGFMDFLLEPLASLYYRIFGKEEDDLSSDYSIDQGREVEKKN